LIQDPVRHLFETGLGDNRLEQVRWADGGLDLLLTLRPPGDNADAFTLQFVWATAVSLLMDFGSYAGSPLVFEARIAPLEHDRWTVTFLFGGAPNGHLSCECNDVRLLRGSRHSNESPN